MSENILFLTGKLAEPSLHKVLAEMPPSGFDYQIAQLGISVAALMTPEFIARRLADARGANRVIVPGMCRGELAPLAEKYGVPVERGPEDLKDIPQYFGHGGKAPDLSRYDVNIFAEIVEAPHVSVEAILARAAHYRAQGADVIDLGCLPIRRSRIWKTPSGRSRPPGSRSVSILWCRTNCCAADRQGPITC